MYTNREFDQLKENFMLEQKKVTKKVNKIWRFFLILSFVLCGLAIVIFPNQFSNPETVWILPVYGGMALLSTLIGFLVTLNFTSEKPFYTVLYKDIIEKYNRDEGVFLDYKAYDKESKEYVKVGGLFTRFATVNNKRHISGNTENQWHYDIYDTILTTSNGKSQSTHFYGIYYVLKKSPDTRIQVRTNGSPKLKGVKFDRHKSFEDIRVYKEENVMLNNMDNEFIKLTKRYHNRPNIKRVYLACLDDEIHFAIWYNKLPTKKVKNLTLDQVNKYYDYFKAELQVLDELSMVSQYDGF